MINADMHKVVEPGLFDVMVGPNSDQTTSVPLSVVGAYGETGIAPPPPPPPGSESGVVSTFDEGKISANYGSWTALSDAVMGGKSTASMQLVEGGANHSKGALRVTGELAPGQFPWAGVFFAPGESAQDIVDLSSKRAISFWAKGDGKQYVVAVATVSRQNQMPAMQMFDAGADWKQYSFPISSFQTDGHDIMNIGFASGQNPGKFDFQIDQVEIR